MPAMEMQSRQQGAALVVIMTFLLVTALIAVSGIETAMLESGMVAKTGRMEQALANAEYGLRLGEAEVLAITQDHAVLDMQAKDAVYPLEGAAAIDPWQTDWSAIPHKGASTDPAVEYVIQYGGPFETEAETTSAVMSSPASIGKAMAYRFIVTARAEIAGSVRLVQSVYVTADAP